MIEGADFIEWHGGLIRNAPGCLLLLFLAPADAVAGDAPDDWFLLCP
jgi:hypothetical protein